MDILIAALTAWIAVQTGLVAVEPPHIQFVGPVIMTETAFGPGAMPRSRLRGLYRQSDSTLFLRSNWNADNLRDRSELVHELVHHFQHAHGLTYDCDAAREELAYDLQIAWLRENGVEDPYEFLEVNAFFVVMVSVCRDAGLD